MYQRGALQSAWRRPLARLARPSKLVASIAAGRTVALSWGFNPSSAAPNRIRPSRTRRSAGSPCRFRLEATGKSVDVDTFRFNCTLPTAVGDWIVNPPSLSERTPRSLSGGGGGIEAAASSTRDAESHGPARSASIVRSINAIQRSRNVQSTHSSLFRCLSALSLFSLSRCPPLLVSSPSLATATRSGGGGVRLALLAGTGLAAARGGRDLLDEARALVVDLAL
jgi:hypothetical protein